MNTMEFHRNSSITFVLCWCFVFNLLSLLASAPLAAQPNFIVILTDDMKDTDLPFMPGVNALLAEQGTTFSNGYVVNSFCCPSRVSILRGQYVHNHGVLSNHVSREGGFQTFHNSGGENSTIATWLQTDGYRTALFGKYLNGYPSPDDRTYIPPGWDEWYAFLIGGNYFNYKMNLNGTLIRYGSEETDYSTDILNELVLDFIDRTTSDPRPFFAYISPHAPHSPALPAPRHEDTYPGVTAPRPPSFNEDDVSDKPLWIREISPFNAAKEAELDNLYRKRLQTLLAVDEMVANIVDKLSAMDLLTNTYILFSSDNGIMLGEHRLANFKGNTHEEAIKIPFLIRGPGIQAGEVLTEKALNIDIAPTLAQLASVTVPDFVDGIALLAADGSPAGGQITGNFLIEQAIAYPEQGIMIPSYSALRTDRALYVEYETSEIELYNLRRDPYQLRSLHNHPRAGSVLPGLASQLEALRTCTGTGCRDLR